MNQGFYKHINNTDLVIEVLKSYYVHSDYIKVKYRCWNQGSQNDPWLLTSSIFKAKIYKLDIKNWEKVYE